MSDLVKAQNTPQFSWYTHWTSFGANGMPDKLIKEGLKQPNQIKISFEKNFKDQILRRLPVISRPTRLDLARVTF
jgi:hypothetical protein